MEKKNKKENKNKKNDKFEKNKFYSRFNLDPNRFGLRSFGESHYGENWRSVVLKSELKDFEKLQVDRKALIVELSFIIEKYLLRYELEARNTLEMKVHDNYINFLIAAYDLKEFLTDQNQFYQKRLEEINNELDQISKD